MHDAVVKRNYKDKLVGHASTGSTAINGRKKSCRKNTGKKNFQPNRSLSENIVDLSKGCDWVWKEK